MDMHEFNNRLALLEPTIDRHLHGHLSISELMVEAAMQNIIIMPIDWSVEEIPQPICKMRPLFNEDRKSESYYIVPADQKL